MSTAAQLLVQSLQALGARKLFGVPGESFLAVLDALHDTVGELDFVNCRHEGGAGFMAAAWGKIKHCTEPGIAIVTRGPGVTHASIGVHTAMQDSVPMLLLVGQVATDMRGREAFQEIDYRAVFGTMAKWVVEIDQADRIPELISRAWKTAISGRPGPVVIALPEDMLVQHTSAEPLRSPCVIREAAPSESALQSVFEILGEAERPLLLIGGCNWTDSGRSALKRFVENAAIPVLSVFRYQDLFDNHSPCFCGEAGVAMLASSRELIQQADVILAINNRFGENSTGSYRLLDVPQPRQRLIHVHAADSELGKVYLPELAIQSGPNTFAERLAAGNLEANPVWAEWCGAARARYESILKLPPQPGRLDMARVTEHLQTVLPSDVVICNGAGNFAFWPNKLFRFGPEARLLAPQAGAMGYGLPAAIAASLAEPQRVVLCFAGDGDFQMSVAELATARQAGCRVIVLIVNNGVYGTIRAHQERHFPARPSGTDMHGNPDFVALASAYGYHAERVETTTDFPAALERARASDVGAVLDLMVPLAGLSPVLPG